MTVLFKKTDKYYQSSTEIEGMVDVIRKQMKTSVIIGNRLTEFTYELTLGILTVVVCVWYMSYVMVTKNHIVEFLTLVLLLVWIGFCFSRYACRNCFSLITIVMIPVLLFDGFQMWRYEPLIKWGSLTGLLISPVTGITFVWRKMKCLPQEMRVCILLEKTFAVTRILWCAVLVVLVIYGRYIMENGIKAVRDITYSVTDTEGNIEDAGNSMEENITVLSRLDLECGWGSLPLSKKMDVLEAVIKVECRNLGMRDAAPTLVVGYIAEEVPAEYNYMTDIVKLSYRYLVDQKNNGYAIAEAICEEMFYRYQAYMAHIEGFNHDVNALVNGSRYEPTYSALSREYAEKGYGSEREAEYRNSVLNYLACS